MPARPFLPPSSPLQAQVERTVPSHSPWVPMDSYIRTDPAWVAWVQAPTGLLPTCDSMALHAGALLPLGAGA